MPDAPRPIDEELIALYQQAGDTIAVEKLVRRHLRRINAMIFQMVLDEAVADDLTQEVFLRALRGLKNFRGASKFSTWLYRVARNAAYGHLRSQRRTRVEYQSQPPESETGQAAPESRVFERERNAEIQAALAALSPKLRMAIVLTTFQDLDVDAAARIEGCTVATMYAIQRPGGEVRVYTTVVRLDRGTDEKYKG